jgi:PKD repeat protein
MDLSTGSPTVWYWNFGDGTNVSGNDSSTRSPMHTYVSAGNYTVNLTVSNANGTSSKLAAINVSVPQQEQSLSAPQSEQIVPPVANFNSNVTSGSAPLSIQFTDLSKNATWWNWDFGDGTNVSGNDSSTRSPVHTYVSAGNYSVNLTVSNANSSDSISALITVSEAGQGAILPVANFRSNVTSGDAPLDIQFNDSSLNATGWDWDFGDGTKNSNEQNLMHTYSTAGNYTVNLTVSNANGTSSKTALIVVFQPILPVANFTSNITSGNAPLNVQFTESSLNATLWNWDFGDGTNVSGNNSSSRSPLHTFSTAGIYTVNLTVSNANGTNSKLDTINVN